MSLEKLIPKNHMLIDDLLTEIDFNHIGSLRVGHMGSELEGGWQALTLFRDGASISSNVISMSRLGNGRL